MDESDYTRRVRAKLPPEAAHIPIWDPTVPHDRPDVPVWRYRSIASGTDLIQLYTARFGLELFGEPGVTTAASVIELAELAAADPERVVDMFEAAHQGGALTWDPQRLMHVETRRGWMGEYRDHLRVN
ncbi:hypothetical protein ACFVUS_29395 [Nocardia sp. NPDC058058]|uniref:hypothetical protein n=1 Tax=Nocardia sp. NPDC058058 TaxID=3346317 RepID=UPI0036DAB057